MLSSEVMLQTKRLKADYTIPITLIALLAYQSVGMYTHVGKGPLDSVIQHQGGAEVRKSMGINTIPGS